MHQTRREFAKTAAIGVTTIAIGGWKSCQQSIVPGNGSDSERYLQATLGEAETARLIELARVAIPDFEESTAYFAALFHDMEMDNAELFTARTSQYSEFVRSLSRPITVALEQSLSADKSGFYGRVAKPDILAGFFADPIWRGHALHVQYPVWAAMGFDPIFKPAQCSARNLKGVADHFLRPPDRMPNAVRSNLLDRARQYCEMKT